jgi:hypothetical protein
MKNWSMRLISALGLAAIILPSAQAAPCMTVTTTGSVGGPQAYQGNANAGTLVSLATMLIIAAQCACNSMLDAARCNGCLRSRSTRRNFMPYSSLTCTMTTAKASLI